MGIGYQVQKYQAEKAARAAREAAELVAREARMREEPMEVIVVDEAPSLEPPPAPTVTPPAAVSQGDFLAAMSLLIQEIRSTNVPEDVQARLAMEAERLALEQERLKREMPENKQSPGISVYSYPEGDLAHPKPALRCRIFWIGYELDTDTLTPREIDLLNRLEPGEYRVTKMDGLGIPFLAQGAYGDRIDPVTNRPELRSLAIWFPCKAADQRQNHGSMVQYLQQALGDRIPTTDELMAEVAKLRAELTRKAVA